MLKQLALGILILHIRIIYGISPILIVPGYTGSQLEARVSDSSECDTGGKWETFWINKKMSAKCINKVLSLTYSNVNGTGRYSNLPGIEVRVPGFGETDTVEVLDYSEPELTTYFYALVSFFEMIGYKKGETIRAAPYDWRLAADELNRTGYYTAFKSLIEEMYEAANEKVSIIVHSMGGPVTLYFLNRVVSQDWKDKYIHVFIPLSGAWSGGNGVLLTFISAIYGADEYSLQFGISFQTMESTVWLLPNPIIWKDKVIVTTATRTYSANQYKEMFDGLGRSTDYDKTMQSLSINGDYPAPNVPLHCFYGIGIPTTEVVNYGVSFPKYFESITYGDGDGAVNVQSSEICLSWSSQKASFKNRIFPLMTHYDMVTNPIVLAAIAEAIYKPTQANKDTKI